MGIHYRDGYSDEELSNSFIDWAAKYGVVECRDATIQANHEWAQSIDPQHLWLEDADGDMVIWANEQSDVFRPNGTMYAEWPRFFYKTESPFNPNDSSISDGLVVGGYFLCEECQSVGDDDDSADPDCSLCEGEGGRFLTVHDEDLREELEELAGEMGVEIPSDFFRPALEK